MEILLFRAALAPSVVLLASVVARRLGPRRSGQLLGAPTTSGPFLLLVCAETGRGAAAQAAHGSVAGQLVVAAFCLVYGRLALAPRTRPRRALLSALLAAGVAGAAGAVAAGVGAGRVWGVWLTASLAVALAVAGLWTWPAAPSREQPRAREARAWETPARMALSGATVLVAVAAAQVLGSYVGGVLCSMPVLLAVLAPSVHRSAGARAAADLTRGALTSAVGTVGFLLMLAAALRPLGPAAAFALAVAGMLLADRVLRTVLARLGRG